MALSSLFGKKKQQNPTSPRPPQQPPPEQQNPTLIYTSQTSLPPYASTATLPPPSYDRPISAHNNAYPPQGWAPSPQYQPVHVTQNYYLAPPLPLRPKKSMFKLSSSNPAAGTSFEIPPCVPGARIMNNGIQYLNPGPCLYDQISAKFDRVLTQIDCEKFNGDAGDLNLDMAVQQPPMWQQQQEMGYANGSGDGKKGVVNNGVSTALTSTNYFAKVNLYANSRLPPDLPPMKLYIPTFPLLCLAAQYSETVYTKPEAHEKETHVGADFRVGTKAMVIKSVPMDTMDIIVFAIRGTQTFMDWAVNLNSAPVSPAGFLDDHGNLCHAGFLSVAQKMIEPVAARLEFLLREDPGRCKCSLLITGHSAGGAVAALIYMHMLSTTPEAQSRLQKLTSFFKRIHCVTFGAPPVSLLPLAKPSDPTLRKSIFLAFVNEGDPVPRADKAYVRSLLDLYASPPPGQGCIIQQSVTKLQPIVSNLAEMSTSTLNLTKTRPPAKKAKSYPPTSPPALWRVPDATLSNAGRLVLLRGVEKYESGKARKKKKSVQESMDEGVVAQMVTDELLRGVVWGDPVCHMMRLYARRIEKLATNAVMGRG